MSSAFTGSHLCTLLRLAQLAATPGAPVGDLQAVPDAVAQELNRGPADVAPPPRLLEFIGAGINAWTAAEGAFKTRETSYLACVGSSAEQFLHCPSVAVHEGGTLVVLDGGGAEQQRLEDIAKVVRAHGATVHHITRRSSRASIDLPADDRRAEGRGPGSTSPSDRSAARHVQ